MPNPHVSKNDINTIIEDIRSVLTINHDITEYFRDELRWLTKMQTMWQISGIRVGLVGITSSGKSTLTNALLGSRLLPTAVRPTSNSIVSCSRGKTVKCTILFIEKTINTIVRYGKDVSKLISHYGDELANKDNKAGVAEIRLESPNFRLGGGITLIDTPGLDAYGLVQHEKVTLEALLPTLDIVVFVTTCKANSDEKMRDYVCIAKDHGKPVVVVQNMVDSVVAKLGHRGEVLKSKEDVIKEHYARVDSVLKKAGLAAVAIFQVSAELAIRGRDAPSGIPELIAGMQREFDALATVIEAGRCRQLDRRLRELIARELAPRSDAAVLTAQKAAMSKLQHQAEEIAQAYSAMVADADAALGAAQADAALITESVSTLTSENVDDASAVQRRIEAWLKGSDTQLCQLNKQMATQIRSDCESLNLNLRDVDLTESLLRPPNTVDLQTTRHSRKVLREQSGWWAKIKRGVDVFDQDWGYDEGERYWSEITDVDGFKKSVETTIDREIDYLCRFVNAVERRSMSVRRQLLGVVNKRLQELGEKINTACVLRDRAVIARQLVKLVDGLRGTQTVSGPHATTVVPPALVSPLREIKVNNATLAMIRLATCIARRRFLAFRDKILFEQAIHGARHAERVLIFGFDGSSLAGFINRFWFDVLKVESNPSLAFERVRVSDARFSEIGVALGSSDMNLRRHGVATTFINTSSVIFLIIDIQQIGTTRSTLCRTGIRFDKLACPVVIVVQAIRELIVSDAVCEAVRELEALINAIGMHVAGVIVNDDTVMYSIITNAMVTAPKSFETTTEQMEFIQALPESHREQAGRIIRRWPATAHSSRTEGTT